MTAMQQILDFRQRKALKQSISDKHNNNNVRYVVELASGVYLVFFWETIFDCELFVDINLWQVSDEVDIRPYEDNMVVLPNHDYFHEEVTMLLLKEFQNAVKEHLFPRVETVTWHEMPKVSYKVNYYRLADPYVNSETVKFTDREQMERAWCSLLAKENIMTRFSAEIAPGVLLMYMWRNNFAVVVDAVRWEIYKHRKPYLYVPAKTVYGFMLDSWDYLKTWDERFQRAIESIERSIVQRPGFEYLELYEKPRGIRSVVNRKK